MNEYEVKMQAMKLAGALEAYAESQDDELLEWIRDRADSFIKVCNTCLTPPEKLGDKGGGGGQAPRSEAESLSGKIAEGILFDYLRRIASEQEAE